MKKTVTLYESEALNILDNTGKIRTDFLKKYLPSTIDSIRFYKFTGTLAALPAIGSFVKKGLFLYYRYLHTNSLVYPLQDMERVIDTATDIYVDPCPCRIMAEDDACDAPIYTCMRINHTAAIQKKRKNAKGLSRDDALLILRNAHEKGLILSLESCVQPYQNNICMCCSCCCIAMKMRYEYGVGIYNSGPYLPAQEPSKCNMCNSCINSCPVGALSLEGTVIKTDLEKCLGCGHCSASCPEDAIQMVFSSDRVRDDKEPGRIKLFLSLVYVYSMMIPSVFLYTLMNGSKQSNMDNAKPNKNDAFVESMQAGELKN